MTDQQRDALWAKRGEIEAAKRAGWALYERKSAGLGLALERLDRLRAEYDALYAEATS